MVNSYVVNRELVNRELVNRQLVIRQLVYYTTTDSWSTDIWSTDSWSTNSWSTDSWPTNSLSTYICSIDIWSTDTLSWDIMLTDFHQQTVGQQTFSQHTVVQQTVGQQRVGQQTFGILNMVNYGQLNMVNWLLSERHLVSTTILSWRSNTLSFDLLWSVQQSLFCRSDANRPKDVGPFWHGRTYNGWRSMGKIISLDIWKWQCITRGNMFFRLMPKEAKGATTLSKTTISKMTFQHNRTVKPAPRHSE